MSRILASWVALLIAANACGGGTTVLGEEPPSQAQSPQNSSDGDNPDPEFDASPGPDHDHDLDDCRDKHCGQLCGQGSGEGVDGFRFCDRRGECVSGLPQCDDEATCDRDEECSDLPNPFWGCLQCNDSSLACSSFRCLDRQCQLSMPTCSSGVVRCEDERDCMAPSLDGCQACSGGMSCPTAHCVFGQCTVIEPQCEAYWPCQGRHCGEYCSRCSPADPGCDEQTNDGVCNAFGECVTGEAFCR